MRTSRTCSTKGDCRHERIPRDYFRAGGTHLLARGLVVGRFHPFHLGHRYLTERIGGQVDRIIAGVDSADRSHSVSKPLASGERVHVVRDLLEETDVRTCLVPDAVTEDLADVDVVDRPGETGGIRRPEGYSAVSLPSFGSPSKVYSPELSCGS